MQICQRMKYTPDGWSFWIPPAIYFYNRTTEYNLLHNYPSLPIIIVSNSTTMLCLLNCYDVTFYRYLLQLRRLSGVRSFNAVEMSVIALLVRLNKLQSITYLSLYHSVCIVDWLFTLRTSCYFQHRTRLLSII